MLARVVIGANFGDEGKGLITDYLCATQGAGVVVRFNGGAQAGHTVVTPKGLRHVFHHFGAGSICHVPTLLSQFFICNPLLWREEAEKLLRMGDLPELYVHPDCIAVGSLVLTDAGLVPIENVTRSMRLWDGCEFVAHGGIVCKGVQNVIHYAGLTATPEHKVWTKEGWVSFGACAATCTPISVTGNGRIPVQERDGYFRSGASQTKWKSVFRSPMRQVRSYLDQRIHESQERKGWMLIVQKARCSAQVAIWAMSECARSLYKGIISEVCGLWWQRNRISFFRYAGDGCLRNDAPTLRPRQTNRSHRQQRSLRTRQFALGNQQRKYEESSKRSECIVYDIVNAGQQRRFTVNGLLVSNCAVTTFADMIINQRLEDSLGLHRHGSVGVGINETITRSEFDELKITMDELWQGVSLEGRLAAVCGKYAKLRCGAPIKDAGDMIADFQRCCEAFANFARPATISQFKDPLFEGAQGLLLDETNKEFFPHVTRSRTGMHNVRILCQEAGIDDIDTYYVSRTYLTRHGAGPLPGEDSTMRFADDTNYVHPYQGELRFAPLDVSALMRRCRADAQGMPFGLVLTHFDQCQARCDAHLVSYGPTRNDVVRPSPWREAIAS